MKEWFKVLAFGAVGLVGWFMHTANISPQLTSGWLIALTIGLAIASTTAMEKARESWMEHGWCFVAVENLVGAGVLMLLAAAACIAAVFAPHSIG